eukprot:3263343-Rhodomonas_salina.1
MEPEGGQGKGGRREEKQGAEGGRQREKEGGTREGRERDQVDAVVLVDVVLLDEQCDLLLRQIASHLLERTLQLGPACHGGGSLA